MRIAGVEKALDTCVFEGNVWGLQWFDHELVGAGFFPQYFRHEDEKRVAVSAADVPPETGLHFQQFKLAKPGPPYTSPTTGAWAKPGPKLGPFTVKLGHGSIVTYWWYRFVDQPSLQPYQWTSEKKQSSKLVWRESTHCGRSIAIICRHLAVASWSRWTRL